MAIWREREQCGGKEGNVEGKRAIWREREQGGGKEGNVEGKRATWRERRQGGGKDESGAYTWMMFHTPVLVLTLTLTTLGETAS